MTKGKFIIMHNSNGWGPCSSNDQPLEPVEIETNIFNSDDNSEKAESEEYQNWISQCPYDIYRKSERMDRICDWLIGDRRANIVSTRNGQTSSQMNEDEDGFSFYDTSRLPKGSYKRGSNRPSTRGRNYGRVPLQQPQPIVSLNNQLKSTKSLKNLERERERQLMKLRKQYGNRQEHKTQQSRIRREASIRVRSDWVVVDEVSFAQLTKLTLPSPTGETFLQLGNVGYYEKSYDKVSTKSEKRLILSQRIPTDVTTLDDPVIRDLCRSDGKYSNILKQSDQCEVYVTDNILVTLMCCSRSVYPWDIMITKIQNKIFLDKRSSQEEITVNETSSDPPNDDDISINSPRNLCNEAMLINANFVHQVVSSNNNTKSFYKMPDGENPIVEQSKNSIGYKYKRFDLRNNIQLIVRCKVDAVSQTKPTDGQLEYLNIHALNEWDSKRSGGIDWRSKIDTQRGAVLAAELKNNNFKLAKWTAASIITEADQIKFGFVSRIHPRDSTRHVVRGVHTFSPHEFAKQMNLNMDNAWGVVRWMVDFLIQQSDGKYVVLKDPMKPTIRIYKVPLESPITDNDIDTEKQVIDFDLGDVDLDSVPLDIDQIAAREASRLLL